MAALCYSKASGNLAPPVLSFLPGWGYFRERPPRPRPHPHHHLSHCHQSSSQTLPNGFQANTPLTAELPEAAEHWLESETCFRRTESVTAEISDDESTKHNRWQKVVVVVVFRPLDAEVSFCLHKSKSAGFLTEHLGSQRPTFCYWYSDCLRRLPPPWPPGGWLQYST